MASFGSAPATIEIDHLTRVEGHANLVVDAWNGAVRRCELQIVEAPRFIEALLRDMPYAQAPRLAARICGICSVAHTMASIQAVENALAIQPTWQTMALRRLMLCAEMLDSHVLHTAMLVAPDLLGAGSIVPLAATQPELVGRALRMKQVAGQICAVVGGRHTHPTATAVGGFTHLPTELQLLDLLDRSANMAADVEATVDLFQTLELPLFDRETLYIALHQEDAYTGSRSQIASSAGGRWMVDRYLDVVTEFQTGHSSAKHAWHDRRPYMVGALARFNLNHAQLHPRARAAATRLGLIPPCHNPFMITRAQVVEMVHFHEDVIKVLQLLLEQGMENEGLVRPQRLSGEGVGAYEAPRGTLYHHYVIRNGSVAEVNCVIPTAQNLANIEDDMRSLAQQKWGLPREELTRQLEMLVRAYDPCISCATHMVEVRIV